MKSKHNQYNRVILTDCDGACLDWEFSFKTWMDLHGHKIVDNSVYDVAQMYGLEKLTAKALVKTFNESAAVGFLPPLRDAQWYIKMLAEKHQFKFVAITSLSLDPYAKKLREQNLAKLFGPETFINVVCLDCGADKDEALAEAADLYPGAIWIEDKPENADIGTSVGLDSVLVEHGHNMFYEGDAKVVKDWAEIYDYAVSKI